MKKKRTWLWIIVAIVVVAIILIIFIAGKSKYVVSLSTSIAQQGKIENTITATGEIQPVYKVDVGTQVSGIVKKLYVDYNTHVKKGDLLAELDKSTLRQQLKQSQASLSTAKSNKELAQKSFDRISALYAKKAATQEEYDQAVTDLTSAKNQLITAQSNYSNAVTNMSYAEIYSPIDGVVLSKEVEEGQTVAASFSTPTLFTIANDLTQMQVEANVDEADIGEVRVGQSVTFTVDAFPKDVFTGTVKQIRLDPTETNNVITYVVIIDAPNPDNKLYPGMTANITIEVDNQEGLVIPLEATYADISSMMKELHKEGYSVEGAAASSKDNGHSNAAPSAAADKQVTNAKATTVDGAGTATSAVKNANIYVVNGKKIERRTVKTGLGDGANIVILDNLKAGEKVLLSVSKEKRNAKSKDASSNPLQMGPPKEKKR